MGKRLTTAMIVFAVAAVLLSGYVAGYVFLGELKDNGDHFVRYFDSDLQMEFFGPAAHAESLLRRAEVYAIHPLPPPVSFDDVQYFPAGPELPLSNDAAAQKAYKDEEEARLR